MSKKNDRLHRLNEWKSEEALAALERAKSKQRVQEGEISEIEAPITYKMTEQDRIFYMENEFTILIRTSMNVVNLFPSMKREPLFKIYVNSVKTGKLAEKDEQQETLKFLLLCHHEDSPFLEITDLNKRRQFAAETLGWKIDRSDKELYERLTNPYYPHTQKLLLAFYRSFGSTISKILFMKKHAIEPALVRATKILHKPNATIEEVRLEIDKMELARKTAALIDELEGSLHLTRKKDKLAAELADAVENDKWIEELYGKENFKLEDLATQKIKTT